MKKQRGITLISLVVTIIVLIILAGVAINLTIGENGIFRRSEEAKLQYEIAQAKEELDIKIAELQVEKQGNATLQDVVDMLKAEDVNYVVSLEEIASITGADVVGDVSEIYVVYKIYQFMVDNRLETEFISIVNGDELPGDLPENTPENPQDVGKIVKLPDEWQTVTPNYVSLDDGSIVTKSTKVATVYAVSVGAGNTVPIPKDFYYVGGNLDTGVVISSEYADSYEKNKRDMTSHSDAINLIGNQFVWIPCTVSEYKKSNWASGSQGNQTGRSNCYWGTETNGAELVQIKKYGGFYVSRYEAGLPVGTTEFTGSLPAGDDEYNITGIAQSRAGVSPWNFIDWNKSKANAQSMYDTTYVKSDLITGTQWDVMINKIGSLKDKDGNTLYSLTNSASWGNYYDGDTNGFTFRGDVSEYKSSAQYAFTTPASTTKANKTYYLLKTGASDHNLTYNLYDVAGNLWEWTDESAAVYNSIGTLATNRVLRGGSFATVSSTRPACFRAGDCSATSTDCSVGFRAVLYIQ